MGHVGAWNPEVQANVMFDGPSVPLIGHLVRGGEGIPSTKGFFNIRTLQLHGWAPQQVGMSRGHWGALQEAAQPGQALW